MLRLIIAISCIIATMAAVQCPSQPLPPGNHEFRVDFGCSRLRNYIVHVPPGLNASSPAPVVFGLHGMGGNPASFQRASKWDATGDKYGFFTVYPLGSQGLLSDRTWNGGACCFSSKNDIEFLLLVLERLKDQVCVDPARVYFWGFSAGGFMSHRMGCEVSNQVTAIAPVGGTLGVSCNPQRPVPMWHHHGALDAVIWYGGGLFKGAEDTVKDWASANQCQGDFEQVFNDQNVVAVAKENCAADGQAALWTDTVGGHTLPRSFLDWEERVWAVWSKVAIPESMVVYRNPDALKVQEINCYEDDMREMALNRAGKLDNYRSMPPEQVAPLLYRSPEEVATDSIKQSRK